MAASILRSAAARCSKLVPSPCLMLPSYKMYSLSEEKVVNINSNLAESDSDSAVVGSSHGWLGLFNKAETAERSSVSLWNPISGSHIKLPPLHTIHVPPYHSRSIKKLVVDDDKCRHAVMIGPANWLGVCCPQRCSEWTLFGSNLYYDDVVASFGGGVYCLESNRGELEIWNVEDPRRPRIEWKDSLWDLGYTDHMDSLDLTLYSVHHLVKDPYSRQLFLVTRHFDVKDLWSDIYPYKTVGFDVHLIEDYCRKVRYMEQSLDGLVMFVGFNNSFAVAAADFPHLIPDSVYFTDHIGLRFYDSIYGGHDIGIYDYKNRTISSCYYPTEYHALKRINPPPFWFTPTSRA